MVVKTKDKDKNWKELVTSLEKRLSKEKKQAKKNV
jgi:hypothetical protein